MQVWRIESFEPKEQPTDAHGTFTAGDCYVVLYSYGEGGAQRIVYTWQGAEASQDERGACAMAAVKVDEVHAGGAAPQVRGDAVPLARRAPCHDLARLHCKAKQRLWRLGL